MTTPPAKPRILVADDESSIRMGCQKILTGEGYDVTTVEDGLSAVQAYTAQPFDLVLLDLRMPGLDGLGAIAQIRRLDPYSVMVMITGYASFETAVKAIQDGAYDYVPKPFTPSELKIVVKRGLERRALVMDRLRLQQERERSLKDLAQEKSRTRTILNAMADPLMVVNAAREVVLVNPAAEIFLKAPDQTIGRPLAEVIRLEPLVQEFQRAWERIGGSVRAASREVTDAEGEKTWLMNVAGIPGDDDGTPAGAVLVLSDITPMKDLERTKTRFVSIVAHELKAPVGAIEGYLDLILPDLAGEMEKFKPKIERCRERAHQLQRLIRELLDLSRMEQGRIERSLETLDPTPLVKEAGEFLQIEAAKKQVTLQLPEPPAGIAVLADRGEINQIFTNLISNAIKYNREGGTVTVTHEIRSGSWVASIRDTGMGISPEHLKHVGEEFFRVKNSQTVQISGTGLGMAIVRRLLDMSHAHLEISSKLGEGSTFTIIWPLEKK